MGLMKNTNNFAKMEDLEKNYNSQKKNFDEKFETINKEIEEMRDYISVRFGEDLNNNRYEKELNNLKKRLDDNSNSLKKEVLDLSEKKLVELFENKNTEYEKSSNEKINIKLNEFAEKSILIHDELEKSIDEFKDILIKIEKDGKNKTVIAKQDKKIKKILSDIEEWKRESSQEIEDLENEIQSLTMKNKEDFKEKFDNLNYNQTINSINGKIENVKIDIETNRKGNEENANQINKKLNLYIEENNNSIEKINKDFNIQMETKLDASEYKKDIEKIKLDIINLNEEVNSKNSENKNTILKMNTDFSKILDTKVNSTIYETNVENTNQKLIKLQENIKNDFDEQKMEIKNLNSNLKNLQDIVVYNKQNILKSIEEYEEKTRIGLEEKIKNMDFDNTVQRIQQNIYKLNDAIINSNEARQKQMNESISIIKKLEEKIEKFEKVDLNTKIESIINAKMKEFEKKYNKKSVENIIEIKPEIDGIEKINKKDNITPKVQNIDNSGNQVIGVYPKKKKIEVKEAKIEKVAAKGIKTSGQIFNKIQIDDENDELTVVEKVFLAKKSEEKQKASIKPINSIIEQEIKVDEIKQEEQPSKKVNQILGI